MLETLYYLFVLYFLWIEIMYIIDVNTRTKRITRITELNTKFSGKEWPDFSTEYRDLLKKCIFELFAILIVLFGGLFTIHWPLWVFMLITSIFIVSPINKKLRKHGKTFGLNLVTWINSVLGFCVALFILINKYHLHYDIEKIVENFLK